MKFIKLTSTICTILLGVILTIRMFIFEDIKEYQSIFYMVGNFVLITYLVFEFYLKKKYIKKEQPASQFAVQNSWKQCVLIEKLIILNFGFSVFVFIINDLFTHYIPKTLTGYYFWLSLGLFAGCYFCRRVYSSAQKNIIREETNKFN